MLQARILTVLALIGLTPLSKVLAGSVVSPRQVQSAPTFSSNPTPEECERIQGVWAQFKNDIKLDEAVSSPTCSRTSPGFQIAEAVSLLTRIKVSSKPDALSFYAKTVKRIKALRFPKPGQRVVSTWGASLEIVPDVGAVMTLYPGFFGSGVTPIERAQMLVHEARHAEPNDPGHCDCLTGRGQIEGTCDFQLETKPEAEGSGYNAGAAFYLRAIESGHTEAKALQHELLDNKFHRIVKPERMREMGVEAPSL